jgi:hemerythrin-like domain-containing protein
MSLHEVGLPVPSPTPLTDLEDSIVTDLIALWYAEHAHFFSLLDLLEEQVAAFHEGEQPDYQIMLDIVAYLREGPDRSHHPREDVIFAQLTIRDASMRIPIARLLQEHRVVAASGQELRSRLEEVLAGAVVPRAALEATAAVYLTYYRHHLVTEEREVLPRAAKALTPQDWKLVGNVLPPGPDPLFGAAPQERYRELRRVLDSRSRP